MHFQSTAFIQQTVHIYRINCKFMKKIQDLEKYKLIVEKVNTKVVHKMTLFPENALC